MKKTLAAGTVAALVVVVGAANATDFNRGSLKDAPAFVPPPLTCTGFYIGGHVGGAWSEIQNNWNFYLDTWSVSNASWKNNNSGVFGGGTVGYNYQSGAFVIGFEADFGSIGLSGFSDQNGSWIKQNDSFYADVTGPPWLRVWPSPDLRQGRLGLSRQPAYCRFLRLLRWQSHI